MSLAVNFSTRDFSAPLLLGLKADVIRLDWSAYGGPERAEIRLTGDREKLLESTRLLRSPVMITDPAGTPVWWGYSEEIVIYLDGIQFRVALDSLYNKVRVRYAFISPDTSKGGALFTDFADDLASQTEFGVKEILLQRDGIDEDFAANLRDTFLRAAAWPKSTLSQRPKPGRFYAFVKCAGWFKTLSWQTYENREGLYANIGSGPGIFTFGQSTSYQSPSQVFTPGASASLKYAYFQLRGVGDPARDLNAQLRDGAGNLLATSEGVPGSTLSNISYRWVKFTFTSAYDLVNSTTYMIGVTCNTPDPARYFAIRTDENQGYGGGYGRYFNGASWLNIPSITNPGGAPDLLFRALCICDTGSQISATANAGSQFFTRITFPVSGVSTCPYRDTGYDCLTEILKLMDLGTSNQRKILAKVTPGLELSFYEQPNPADPKIYMDRKGNFYSNQGTALKPYFPPVGDFARYSGSNRIMMPFDKDRVPACFIERAAYWPNTGRVKIN